MSTVEQKDKTQIKIDFKRIGRLISKEEFVTGYWHFVVREGKINRNFVWQDYKICPNSKDNPFNNGQYVTSGQNISFKTKEYELNGRKFDRIYDVKAIVRIGNYD